MSMPLRLPRRPSVQSIGALLFSTALMGSIGVCLPALAQTMVPGQHITQGGSGTPISPGTILSNPPITTQPPRPGAPQLPIRNYTLPTQDSPQLPIRNYAPPIQGFQPGQGYRPGQQFLPPSQIFRQGTPERNDQPSPIDPYDSQRLPPNQINRFDLNNTNDNRFPTSIQSFGNSTTHRGAPPYTSGGTGSNGIVVTGRRNPDPVRNPTGLPYTLSGETHVSTPVGQRSIPDRHYHDDYFYPSNTTSTIVLGDGQVALLGGYYYGNYCDTYYGAGTYPSVYYDYAGFPEYIYNPSVVVLSQPYYPVYDTSYLPFLHTRISGDLQPD